MSKPYIKLDLDTMYDPKVAMLIERRGKSWAWDMAMCFCALGEFYGQVQLVDDEQRLHLERMVGRKGKRLDAFLEELADCRLIDANLLHEEMIVASSRSIRDGEARAKRKRYAKEASDAAAEKRKRDRCGVP